MRRVVSLPVILITRPKGCSGTDNGREFNAVIEKDENGFFVASVPTLRGCHTQAKSLDVLMKRIREAIELCLEVEEPVTNEFIGVQRVSV
jgi:predicted RNase H-like HicB family nuclease